MWGEKNPKNQNVFSLFHTTSVTCHPTSLPCFFRSKGLQKFSVLQFRWKSTPWCVSSCRGLSICIWNKLRKHKPTAESTPIFWQLLPRRALSLDSGEDEARCQRSSPRQNTVRAQRYNVQSGSNWARGWHFVKCTGILTFWLDIKMLFEFCGHGI